ncbi:hypothetical protein [Enterovibrio calviensis]|uniref:hypothetical protein n=1 Tax=Enterovibrio calviensis TaxID=91359 RepID=UPI00048623D8|nr:hypothetical protein [Enterovibrio calviensis]
MSALDKLKGEWSSSRRQIAENSRLQVALWAIAYIALFYLILVAMDFKESLIAENQQLREQVVDQQRLENGPDWQQRVATTQSALDALSKNHLVAANEAQGRAAVQAILGEKVSDYDVYRPQISVSSAPLAEPDSGLIPVQSSVKGRLTGDKLFALIHDLESGQPAFRVTSITVRSGKGKDIGFEVLLTAWATPWGGA